MVNRKIFLFVVSTITIMVFLLSFSEREPKIIPEETLNAEANSNLSFHEKINNILKSEKLKGSLIGISIRDADTGEEIFEHQGNIRMHPASNMKLLTGAAALEILGKNYQFNTELSTDGVQEDNVLNGNMYLKGKGDPTLLKEDLDTFARELKEQGIKEIKGNIIADDSWYDDIRLSQDLNWSDESFYTGAQVSALTLSPDSDFDTGTVIIEVHPSNSIGEKTQIKVIPSNQHVTIINNSKMVSEKEIRDISIEREHGTNKIIVEGMMPLNSKAYRSYIAVWEPTNYVLKVFHHSLEEHGIKLKGDLETGKTPENTHKLATKKSIPLEEILIPFMKLSNNGIGEMLVKEMGRKIYNKGSWDAGLQVMKEVSSSLGIDANTILLRDGSGMSHKNYIPASELTDMLYHIQTKEWFDEFEKSLPVAGETERLIGGTLRNRLNSEQTSGKVKAKTGTLTGVYTLSGYITNQHGENLIFSILNNNYIVDNLEIGTIQDEIVTLLATHRFK